MSLDMDPYDLVPSSSHVPSGGHATSAMGVGSTEQGQGLGPSVSSRHLSDVTNTTHPLLQRSHSINGTSTNQGSGQANNQGANKRPRPTITSSSGGGMGLTGPNSAASKGMHTLFILFLPYAIVVTMIGKGKD